MKLLFQRQVLLPLTRFAQHRSLPFSGGAKLFDIFMMFRRSLTFGDFDLRAYAMAFNFFLAIVPALILVYALIPFLPIPNLEVQITAFVERVLPSDIAGFMTRIVHDTFEDSNIGVLSVTTITVYVFIRRGILVIIKSFNANKKVEEDQFLSRSFFKQEVTILKILLTLITIFLASIVLNGVASSLLDNLLNLLNANKLITKWLIKTVSYIVGLITLIFGLSVIYRQAPAVQKKWKRLNPGGLVAGVLLFIAQLLIGTFLEAFENVNKIFGSLSALIIFMLWLYWQSIVLLLGFELNLSIRRARHIDQHRKNPVIAGESTVPTQNGAQEQQQTDS